MANWKCYGCNVPFTEDNTTKYAIETGRGRCRQCSRDYSVKQRLRNPLQTILCRVKKGAKQRGMVFELTIDDLPKIPEFCPVFPWIRLAYNVGQGRKPNAVSLDRIDNTVGYTKGNVRFISDRANILRRDASTEELEHLWLDAKAHV